MNWTAYEDPALPLIKAAEPDDPDDPGDADAAHKLLQMAAARIKDPDPLVAYLARRLSAWGPKFDERSARAAFRLVGERSRVDAVERAEALAHYLLLRKRGVPRHDALDQVAEQAKRSVKWAEALVDHPTAVEDIAAGVLNKRRRETS